MSNSDYTPPKVWAWDKENGGKWAGLNRPIAGATHEEILPTGDKDLQLYSLGTPNGIKVTVMLEELLALGKTEAAYDVHVINIGKGDQFGSEFTKLNPNSKIPVLLDRSGDEPESIFESCAILHYLANKFDAFWPENPKDQVTRGALDAAVITKPISIDNNHNWFPFANEELVLLTAPEVEGDDPLQLLHDMPYIRHTKRGAMGMVVEQWMKQNNVSVHEVMVMESTETLSSMVAHNLGVSIVPNLCMPDPTFANLRKIPLGSTTIPRTLGVLTRADCSKIQLIDRLLEEIENTLQ